MRFITQNIDWTKFNGTRRVGLINADYSILCEAFGAPCGLMDELKSDAAWDIEFSDGTVATIYNYKDGKNYNGPSGRSLENIEEWHIGGKSSRAETQVEKALEEFWTKKQKQQAKAQAKKAVPAKTTTNTSARQLVTGADGDVVFLAHRKMFVGFWGGKRVVIKSTEQKCREYMTKTYGSK